MRSLGRLTVDVAAGVAITGSALTFMLGLGVVAAGHVLVCAGNLIEAGALACAMKLARAPEVDSNDSEEMEN